MIIYNVGRVCEVKLSSWPVLPALLKRPPSQLDYILQSVISQIYIILYVIYKNIVDKMQTIYYNNSAGRSCTTHDHFRRNIMNRSLTGNDIINALEKRIGIHMQMTKSHIDAAREAQLKDPHNKQTTIMRMESRSLIIDEYASTVRALLWLAQELGEEHDLGEDYFQALRDIRERDLIQYHIILQKDHFRWWSEH